MLLRPPSAACLLASVSQLADTSKANKLLQHPLKLRRPQRARDLVVVRYQAPNRESSMHDVRRVLERRLAARATKASQKNAIILIWTQLIIDATSARFHEVVAARPFLGRSRRRNASDGAAR